MEPGRNRIILNMFAQSIPISTPFSSLNTSNVTSPHHTHSRTQSFTKIPPNPNHLYTHARVPSQKKLTLTCQNVPPNSRPVKREGESGLKKKGPFQFQNHSHFISMGSSRVAEGEISFSKAQTQNNYLSELKASFEERIKQLQQAYAQSTNDSAYQIRELQRQLAINSHSLQVKDKSIKQLSALCRGYQSKISKFSQSTNSIVLTKINDLQTRIRLIANHYDQLKEQHQQKIEDLTGQVIAYFGHQFQGLKEKSCFLIKNGMIRIGELQQDLQLARNRQDKQSQGTRGSMGSVGSQLSLGRNINNQDQCGTSFWDDCFFHPSESHSPSFPSDDYQMIAEMAGKRSQPLHCWLDSQGHIRYTDTNSFIFSRYGDRIKLSHEQTESLVSDGLMILF